MKKMLNKRKKRKKERKKGRKKETVWNQEKLRK